MKIYSKAMIAEIEKKFSDTAFTLTQERSDFLLPQILDFVKKEKWLNLRPEYQRRLVWDDVKRSLFIESLLLNIPIPSLFLYESELGRYEVMDGQQRLSTIVDFYSNIFHLRGLERWKELNGLRYCDLPLTLQRGLDRRRLSSTVLLVGSSTETELQKSDIRKIVFERLNTGGQQLNSQELRNCLYAGNFNDMLIQLSKTPLFRKCWEIPPYDHSDNSEGNAKQRLRNDRLYRRMIDCEIVLRFFALRHKNNIKGSLRSMLDRCMKDNANATKGQLNAMIEDFNSRIKLAHQLFDDKVFRYMSSEGQWKLSYSLFDGIMVALDQLWMKRDTLKLHKNKINQSLNKLLSNQKAYEVIVGRPSTSKAVIKRIKLIVIAFNRATKK